MSSTNRWIVTDDTNGVDPTGMTGGLDSALAFRKIASHAGRGAQGAMACKLALALNPVAAQATVTFSNNGTNADTLTVAGIAITLVTSGAAASSHQVNLGALGTGVDVAAWVAALINGQTSAGYTGSSTSWAGICTASAASGVITLTAALPGTIGNGLALAASSTAIAITHAWGASVAGTEGTSAVFSLGK